MKPIKFKEQNVVYAQDQPQYMPLPGYRVSTDVPEGNFVSCWKPSFWDRIRILFGGNVWVETWTFWKKLQPTKLTTIKKEVLNANN